MGTHTNDGNCIFCQPELVFALYISQWIGFMLERRAWSGCEWEREGMGRGVERPACVLVVVRLTGCGTHSSHSASLFGTHRKFSIFSLISFNGTGHSRRQPPSPSPPLQTHTHNYLVQIQPHPFAHTPHTHTLIAGVGIWKANERTEHEKKGKQTNWIFFVL